MTTTGVKSVILIIAVGILIGGCGGSNAPTAALQPHATNTVKPAATQPTYVIATPLLGDLDEDHSPGVGDAIKILRIVVGLDDDTPVADANQNCSTDVGDAIKLLRIVVGLDTDWPLTWQKTWVSGDVKEYIDEGNTPPLEGVEVTVGGQSDTSDSSGEFEIHCVPLGNQTIAVSKTGYDLAGTLPASVNVRPVITGISTIYMIASGSTPPPAP